MPVGGFAGVVKIGGSGIMGSARNLFLFAPSPLAELFPADLAQTPRPELYKNLEPMYAFGHGPSYATFDYKELSVRGGESIASFTVTNIGKVAGADVPQVYLTDAAGERRVRLLGFERVELAPGASKTVTITADPRLFARFDGAKKRWRIEGGEYSTELSRSAENPLERAAVKLKARSFAR